MTVSRLLFTSGFIATTAIATLAPRAEAAPGSSGNVYFHLDGAPVLSESNSSLHTYGGSFAGEGDVSTASTMGYDMKTTLGYAFGGRWLVGISYNLLSTSTKRNAVAGGDNARDSKASRSEYGPTLGVLYNGWRLNAIYLLGSEAQYTDKLSDSDGATTFDAETFNNKGTGFLVNFGYSYALTPWLHIGPSLIYRKVTYSSRTLKDKLTPANDYTDRTFSTKPVETSLTPYFSLTLRF